MKTLRQLIAQHKWLLDIPISLLECLDFEQEDLDSRENDYVFVNGEDLVDEFIEKLTDKVYSTYNKCLVTFEIVGDTLKVTDKYNDFTEEVPLTDRIYIMKLLTYYHKYPAMDYDEGRKDFMVSKGEYESIKIWLDSLTKM